jgi:hypothetical protein
MFIGFVVASDCVEVTQQLAFRRAVVIFRGKFIGVEDVSFEPTENADTAKLATKRSESGDPRVLTFSVDKVWKGQAAKTIRIFAFGKPPMGTGYPFRRDIGYVVYALEEVGHSRERIRHLSGGAPVYDLGLCALRIRTDVERESRLLEKRAAAGK